MIEKKDYLQALDIVLQYHEQIKNSIPKKKTNFDLEVGDTIIFSKVASKYLTVGKEYFVHYVGNNFEKWDGVYEIEQDDGKMRMLKRSTQGYYWKIKNV